MSFAGMRVLSLESRRAREMATLIGKHGGEVTVAPSMREVPIEENDAVFAVAEELFAGHFDMVIFMTGVGVRALDRLLATRYPMERFPEALRRLTVVARGPKPAAALREIGRAADITAPEPNTWREVVAAIDGRPERRIAVQEYGRSNLELLDALRREGAEVTPIQIYTWDLPEDTAPLRNAVRRLAAGGFDVLVLTTPNQITSLFRIAEEEGVSEEVRAACDRTMIASVGPSTTEMLVSHGLRPDIEPTRPKMGILIREAAEQAPALVASKRAR